MVSAATEGWHLLWFNEPCPRINLAALKKLAGENVTPIGIGRHAHECSVIQDLLREDAVDIIRPDLGLNGISQIRRMAAIAETYYVAVAPMHDGGPIATAAALHLAAALPNFFIQQIPFPDAEEDRRLRLELTAARVELVKDGFVELPAGPGLGITVNEQALEKYAEKTS
jgi:galactonate dehydratase